MVYQHQISVGCIGNRYLTTYATKGLLEIYDFGKDGSLPEPKITLIEDKSVIKGMCADGDNLLVLSGKSVYRIRPEKISAEKPLCEQTDGVIMEGMLSMPVVIGNLVFTGKRCSGNWNILKMNNHRTEAKLLKSLTFRGNPGMAVFDGERYCLPLGYGGLVSFVLDAKVQ